MSGAHPRLSDAESDFEVRVARLRSRRAATRREVAGGFATPTRVEDGRHDVDVAHVRRSRRDAASPGATTISGILQRRLVREEAVRQLAVIAARLRRDPPVTIDERVRIGASIGASCCASASSTYATSPRYGRRGTASRTARADGRAHAGRRDAPRGIASCPDSHVHHFDAASRTAPPGAPGSTKSSDRRALAVVVVVDVEAVR